MLNTETINKQLFSGRMDAFLLGRWGIITLIAIFALSQRAQAAPGDIIEQFANSWASSTIGLGYDPVLHIVRYAHESQSSSHRATIYDVNVSIPHAVVGSVALSAKNSGWPWQVDNRNGVTYDSDTETYFLPDYQGDLSYLDDNIVEIDADGKLQAYWETDTQVGGPGCTGGTVNTIIDISYDPDHSRQYYVTAADDGNKIYHLDLSDKSGGTSSRSVCVLKKTIVPPDLDGIMSDILGIEWDPISEGFWVSDWKSDNIALLDRDFNVKLVLSLKTPSGYSSGITPMYGVEDGPYPLWVTDFTSNKTTIVESGFSTATTPQADMAVTKDDGVDTYFRGMKLTYTVVLTNNGLNPAENVTFVDNAPANTSITSWECQALGDVTCPNESGAGDINEIIPLFPVGTEFRYTITVQTTVLTSGNLTNTATVTADTEDPVPVNNSAQDTNSEQTATPFLLNSDGSNTYTPGMQTTYHVILANPNMTPSINEFTFTDVASAETTMSWTCQGLGVGAACPAASGTGSISADISSLGMESALYFIVTIDTPSSFTGDLVHTAAVNSSKFTPMSVTDTNQQHSLADLAVTVASSQTTYTPDTTTTYTIAAANAGPSDATNVILRSLAPAETTITNWTCTASSGAVCPNSSGSGDLNETVGSLPAGEHLDYALTLAIDATYGAEGGLGGALTHSASLSGAEADPDTTNNSANVVKTRITYTLTYTAGAGGTIAGATPQTVEHGADGTVVEAVPNTGYQFVQWSDGSIANPRTDTNVTADISVTALFEVTPPSDNSYLLWTK